MREFDLVVIGGGNTGLAAAHGVASEGKRVALVDKGAIGGLCSLAGCNPKKVFVRASEVLDEIRHAAEHGISIGDLRIDFERVWRRKRTFTDPVPAGAERSLATAGVERLTGAARFTGHDTLAVEGDPLRAGAFVIATGSHPRALSFPGAELTKISDDVLELREPPKRMIIVGAGVIAFEFSHVFARFGTQVTILSHSRRTIPGFDDDFAEIAVEFTRRLGIELLLEARVVSLSRSNGSMQVVISHEGQSIMRDADFVLNAAGRVAAIADLDLAAAGVEKGPRGVVVDAFLRSTSNRRVFAGGDAHGIRQLSPVASYEGRVIARNYLQGDVEEVDYASVPHAIFTTPPLAAVGLTETSAREMGLDIDVRISDMKEWKVYAIAGATAAQAKVIAERASGKILGAQLFGPSAPEVIHLFALAIRCGLTAKDLKRMVYAYPTFSSAMSSAVP